MPSGELVDPVHLSVKALSRLGPAEFECVLRWLAAERKAQEDRLAKADEALQATRAEIIRSAEVRAEQLKRMKQERPWQFD
jgi:hypothetical protein